MLKIDYRFAMKELIGANGLGKKQLAAAVRKAEAARKELAARRGRGEIGFAAVLGDQAMLDSCVALGKKYRGRLDNVVVLGIGGSALGPRALARALVPNPLLKDNSPRLLACDNVDPEELSEIFKIAFSGRSLFLAISKSGATPETGSQLLHVVNRLKKHYGKNWQKRLVAITDPEKGILRKFADAHGLQSLAVPPKVGGRYSVLSPVGLAPAALLGIDPEDLIRGATIVDQIVFSGRHNPCAAELLAAFYFAFAARGRNMLVMMPYSSKLADLSEWFAQLWAESLGKKLSLAGKKVHAGTTPVRALGATDQHSQLQLYLEGPPDKLVTFLKVENFRRELDIPEPAAGLEELAWLSGHSFAELINVEQFATSASLARSGRPSITISIPRIDAYNLGALFYLFELVTVLEASLWGINPFDQPAVELGKQYTAALMGRPGFEDKERELEQFDKKAGQFIWPRK